MEAGLSLTVGSRPGAVIRAVKESQACLPHATVVRSVDLEGENCNLTAGKDLDIGRMCMSTGRARPPRPGRRGQAHGGPPLPARRIRGSFDRGRGG